MSDLAWGIPDGRHAREHQLNQRINRTILTDPNKVTRYHTDAAAHLQLEVLRGVLLLADKAMAAEGIGFEVRDRVVHWILIGEPAPERETDPDAELDEAVRMRLAERDSWVRYLDGLPIEVPPMLKEM